MDARQKIRSLIHKCSLLRAQTLDGEAYNEKNGQKSNKIIERTERVIFGNEPLCFLDTESKSTESRHGSTGTAHFETTNNRRNSQIQCNSGPQFGK